jgi:hypothetical protein
MTLEDDKREKFRKDLIKTLPIEVEEDSEDERWGFGTPMGAIAMQINHHHSISHGNSGTVNFSNSNDRIQHQTQNGPI